MKTTNTFEVKIYIARCIYTIKTLCQRYCVSGLCVTVTPTDYIFTGGSELGVIIGLINYARFPTTNCSSITQKAIELAKILMNECGQRSCSVVDPEITYYLENELINIPR